MGEEWEKENEDETENNFLHFNLCISLSKNQFWILIILPGVSEVHLTEPLTARKISVLDMSHEYLIPTETWIWTGKNSLNRFSFYPHSDSLINVFIFFTEFAHSMQHTSEIAFFRITKITLFLRPSGEPLA